MVNSDSHNLPSSACLIPKPEQEEVESPLLSEPQCSSSLGSSSMPEIMQCDHEFTSTIRREEGPGRPIQVVEFSSDGTLLFQEDVLQQCFLRPDVRETPVCVVSIVGERRKGKSFLLNYLLRKLSNMDEWDRMSDSEPLRGFEWQCGSESMTKGVFIWSQPLFLETQEGKLAVFLVDTEGSVDLSREMELSVKLCALSVFLSSHVIFNVHADVTTTDLDYLELLHLVVEKGGGAFDKQYFQGFEFLVRDWTQTQEFGQTGGSRHLEKIIQRLEKSGTNKQALRILKEKRPRCHLMPFPGNKLIWSQQGTMREMDEQFQHCLKEFINHIGQVLQTTRSTMTGKTLAGKFKEMAHMILKSNYRISSPAELIHTLNLLTIQQLKQEFTIFLSEQRSIMHNTTLGIKGNVEQKEKELLARVQGEVSQQDFEELSQFLSSERVKFIIERAKKEFTDFLNEQRSIMHDSTLGIKGNVEQKEKELLTRVQGEVSQQDSQELSQFLSSEREKFLKEYTLLIFKKAKEDFTNFLNEQRSIMYNTTLGIKRNVEQKEKDLLDRVQGEVSQQDSQELSQFLSSEREKFLKEYTLLIIKKAKKEFTDFLNEQRSIMHNTTLGIKGNVEQMEKDLLARVQGEVSQQDFQELSQFLNSERVKFIIERAKKEFTDFLNEQRSIMHDPTLGIKRNVEQKEKDLLARVQGEVSQQVSQELSQFLSSERVKFLKEYTLLIIKKAKEDFTNFLNKQRSIMHDPTLGIKRNVEQKEKDLLARVRGEVSQRVSQELSQFLSSERVKFLKEYSLLITKKAKEDFTNFLNEQRSIMHDPTLGIKGNVEQKEKDLLARVQGEVSQQDFQELSQFLSSEREKFIIERAKKEFTDFLNEQRSIMHNTTLGIKGNVEQKEKELLARVQGEVSQQVSQEISQFLSSERVKFLKEYTLLIIKKAKEDFTNFLNEQRSIMHNTTLGIKGNVEQKEKDLLDRVRGEVSQQDSQELSQFLSSEREKFLKEYTLLIIEKAKEDFTNFRNKQRSIMHNTTWAIKGNVEQKENELLAHVQGEVSQQDFQELSQFLSSERVKFIIERAKKEFTDFLNEQGKVLLTRPDTMKETVEGKKEELLDCVQDQIESRQDFKEFEKYMAAECETFLKKHKIMFGVKVGCIVAGSVLTATAGAAGGLVVGGVMAVSAGVSVATGAGVGALSAFAKFFKTKTEPEK